MKNNVFLDSNLLVYLYSSDEPEKQLVVQKLIEKYKDICVSTQVLFEFGYVMNRKLKKNYSIILKALEEFKEGFTIIVVTYEILQYAMKLADKINYSLPDLVIVSSAINSECKILFSEDMGNKQLIEKSVMIINPFKTFN